LIAGFAWQKGIYSSATLKFAFLKTSREGGRGLMRAGAKTLYQGIYSKMTKSLQKIISSAVGIGLAVMVNGCDAPKPRMGCLPTSTPGSRFLNPYNLGAHSYGYRNVFFEKNGIVYTCRAGHIDITHLRWAADYTKYLAKRTYKTLMNNCTGFSFKSPLERSKQVVRFDYPRYWKNLSQKSRERIATRIERKIIMGPVGNQQYDPLRHYTAVEYDNDSEIVVVSNGIQTEAILETYKLLYNTESLPAGDYLEVADDLLIPVQDLPVQRRPLPLGVVPVGSGRDGRGDGRGLGRAGAPDPGRHGCGGDGCVRGRGRSGPVT